MSQTGKINCILDSERICVREVSPLGSTFQAIVSVMAVKIQLSSPRGVRLSLSLPGILHHTQHNTDGTVSAALTACHIVDSAHKVATAQ